MPRTKSSKKREVKPKKLRQKQKQKQQQNVKINVTQGGSGGGGAPIIIPSQTPMQFRDTSGENVRLTGLIKDLENRIAGFKQPVAIKEPISNPANDPITTRSVYNAPINYNDDLREEIIREIKPPSIPKNPPIEVPTGFNAPITNNDDLVEQISRQVMQKALNEVESRTNMPVRSFGVELVEETPKKKRGPKKGTKYRPREPRLPEATPEIPNTFLTNINESNVPSSDFENILQRRRSEFTTPITQSSANETPASDVDFV